MCRLQSCTLLLAKRCKTRVGEGVVGIEVVETLAMADAVDNGSHSEKGRQVVENREMNNGLWRMLEGRCPKFNGFWWSDGDIVVLYHPIERSRCWVFANSLVSQHLLQMWQTKGWTQSEIESKRSLKNEVYEDKVIVDA